MTERKVCPHCGSVSLTPLNNRHNTAAVDGGYYCHECQQHCERPDTAEKVRCKPASGLARRLWEMDGDAL